MPGFGAYGKMPGLGDFFRLNMSAGFIDPWDRWLQTALTHARAQLEDRWDGIYMSAPIWRFSLPPGLAGPQAMVGVFMASVDRVGRQFPLTLASPVDGATPGAAHFANTDLFETAEALALSMLEEGMGREQLLAGLMQLAAPVAALAPLQATPRGAGTGLRSAAPLPRVLAAHALPAERARGSVWSMALEGDHRALFCKGLPDAAEFHAIVDPEAPLWALKAQS